MRKKSTRPRDRSLVRLVSTGLSPAMRRRLPFSVRKTYVFLGEIANMPGHCVVVDMKTGHVFSGYHSDNFRELADEEV